MYLYLLAFKRGLKHYYEIYTQKGIQRTGKNIISHHQEFLVHGRMRNNLSYTNEKLISRMRKASIVFSLYHRQGIYIKIIVLFYTEKTIV